MPAVDGGEQFLIAFVEVAAIEAFGGVSGAIVIVMGVGHQFTAYEFAGVLYGCSREMHDSIAEEWLSAGGCNTREDILHDLSVMTDNDLVTEAMADWDLAGAEDAVSEFSEEELRGAFYRIRHSFDEHFGKDY